MKWVDFVKDITDDLSKVRRIVTQDDGIKFIKENYMKMTRKKLLKEMENFMNVALDPEIEYGAIVDKYYSRKEKLKAIEKL